eukprot:6417890-Pyramimonas_sp.AAC.1
MCYQPDHLPLVGPFPRQMLSASGTKYNINGGGMTKVATHLSPVIDESPGTTDKYYRCRESDLRKMKNSPLGKGASGSVYKAVNIPTGEIVALKEIDALDKVASLSQRTSF